MKFVNCTYERKFGGGKGRNVEEYGSETISIEATVGEEEDIEIKEFFRAVMQMKKVAYRVNSTSVNDGD